MANNLKTQISQYIALLLRHKPEVGGLTLDNHGWCDTKALIKSIKMEFNNFNMELLEEIVREDSKQRYSFNENKTKIRANQGHSIKVDLEFKEIHPDKPLYHGTATRFLNSIMKEGVKPQSRQWVHLTDNLEEAVATGKRHGTPVILVINVANMLKDGYKFYISENNRYMIKEIPSKYIIETRYLYDN